MLLALAHLLQGRQGGKSSHRRCLGRAAALFVVLSILILTYAPLMTWVAYQFRVDDPPLRSDALVVMLTGYPDRAEKAAEFYRRGLAPVILIGEGEEHLGETRFTRDVLIERGVPPEAICLLPGGTVRNTHDEAARAGVFLKASGTLRVTVLTTAFHTGRTRRTFREVLQGAGVEVRMAASTNPQFREEDWYTNWVGIKHYFLEAIKILYYRARY